MDPSKNRKKESDPKRSSIRLVQKWRWNWQNTLYSQRNWWQNLYWSTASICKGWKETCAWFSSAFWCIVNCFSGKIFFQNVQKKLNHYYIFYAILSYINILDCVQSLSASLLSLTLLNLIIIGLKIYCRFSMVLIYQENTPW